MALEAILPVPVLVVEDEAIIAMDIIGIVEGARVQVVGLDVKDLLTGEVDAFGVNQHARVLLGVRFTLAQG